MKNIASPNNKKPRPQLKRRLAFDAQAFLNSAGVARKVVAYRRSQKIYSQGDPAKSVMYIQEGGVKLSVVNEVGKEAVVAILAPADFLGEGCLAGQEMAYILSRNIRVEEDLIDQLFNSSEKRLARTLLLLARFGAESQPQQVHPKISQEMLAEMVGTTRSRVNFFMNKFRKLGFIRYNGGLQVHSSLLSVVLHE